MFMSSFFLMIILCKLTTQGINTKKKGINP